MIQDIYPHQLKNEYNPNAIIKDDDLVIAFKDNQVLMFNKSTFPKVHEINSKNLRYLFKIDHLQVFLALDEIKPFGEYCYTNLFELRGHLLGYNLYVLYTAKHLNDWYRDHIYCGRCGHKLSHSNKERALTCTCGNTIYPRIMPAVIVGVFNQDKILITRYKTGFKHNALIAGFVEIGETVEETVKREVFEETGIQVKNITYYKSQPWGTANDILLGYFCEVDGDDTILMDENELKLAKWTTANELLLQPDDISLTNEMMKMFKEGKIKSSFDAKQIVGI